MLALTVLHICICAFLIFVILLQPGKADGGAVFGGSSSQTIFGSKGAGNFLTKTTSVCAILFLLTSFLLTRSKLLENTRSVISADAAASSGATPSVSPTPAAAAATPAAEPTKAAEAPKAPEAPKK